MAFQTVSLGLTIVVPTTGQTNWGARLYTDTWKKISQHDHTGGGRGSPISTAAIAANAIDDTKLRLRNAQWLRSRNAAGLGDVNVLRVNALDQIALGANVGLTQAATVTPLADTQTINWQNGNIQTIDLESASADVTLTLSNPQQGACYKLWVIQGPVARDLIWPASVKFPAGQAPLLSAADDAIDLVELYYTGSEYRAWWDNDFR